MEQPSIFDNVFDIRIDQESQGLLKTITRWAKMIAVLGFVSMGLTLIHSVLLKLWKDPDAAGPVELKALEAGLTIVIVIISITLNILLYRFATHTARSLETMSQESFNAGTNHLRNYFKMMGILMIVCVSLLVLGMFAYIITLGLR